MGIETEKTVLSSIVPHRIKEIPAITIRRWKTGEGIEKATV